jgi:hypothetical protein
MTSVCPGKRSRLKWIVSAGMARRPLDEAPSGVGKNLVEEDPSLVEGDGHAEGGEGKVQRLPLLVDHQGDRHGDAHRHQHEDFHFIFIAYSPAGSQGGEGALCRLLRTWTRLFAPLAPFAVAAAAPEKKTISRNDPFIRRFSMNARSGAVLAWMMLNPH